MVKFERGDDNLVQGGKGGWGNQKTRQPESGAVLFSSSLSFGVLTLLVFESVFSLFFFFSV